MGRGKDPTQGAGGGGAGGGGVGLRAGLASGAQGSRAQRGRATGGADVLSMLFGDGRSGQRAGGGHPAGGPGGLQWSGDYPSFVCEIFSKIFRDNFVHSFCLDQVGRRLKHPFMKSSIKIDVGHGQEPIISIRHVRTDDLRDKFLAAFFDRLAYESNLAYIEFSGVGGSEGGETYSDVVIHAIPPGGLSCVVIPGKEVPPTNYYEKLTLTQAREMCVSLFKTLPQDVAHEVKSEILNYFTGVDAGTIKPSVPPQYGPRTTMHHPV